MTLSRLAPFALGLSVALAAPAAATLPTPPMTAATRDNQAFLFHAGASDIFEISTSMEMVMKSQNPDVRAYASTLIDHHTRATNASLAAAKAVGIMPPPPELTPMQKGLITQLRAAPAASRDRVYLTQQVASHQMALQMVQGYARSGDTAQLRAAAAALVPVVQGHLNDARRLLGRVR